MGGIKEFVRLNCEAPERAETVSATTTAITEKCFFISIISGAGRA
jgi:hypothetical protein